MIYCGIGSRATPTVVLDLMTEIGMYFGKYGILLRSGGAAGADMAFENGCDAVKGPKEIFFPSVRFNGRSAKEGAGRFYLGAPNVNNTLAMAVGKKVWEKRPTVPCRWESLKEYTRMLMARNTLQLLGRNLSEPTNLIICWTTDGEATGGTGQALAMAEMANQNPKLDYVIPILNLQREVDRNLITSVLRDDISLTVLFEGPRNALLKQYSKGVYKQS